MRWSRRSLDTFSVKVNAHTLRVPYTPTFMAPKFLLLLTVPMAGLFLAAYLLGAGTGALAMAVIFGGLALLALTFK